MLAAFVQFGIQPGPLLFENEGPLVWALIASLFIGNFLLLLVNLPLAPVWAKLLRLPRPYLYAGILFFATLGAYSVNLQAFDLAILLVLGALGFLMRRYGLPVLPLILGVILGPRLEKQLRQTLQLSAGDVSGLWSEPIAVVVYIIVALVLLWPFLFKMWRRNRRGGVAVASGVAPAPAPAGGPADAQAADSPAKDSPTASGSTAVGEGHPDPTDGRKDTPKVSHANHGQEKQ
jgi:putative tricarboxylic transport membrane protein